MCYLIEKRMNKTGCIALQTEPGEEMAKFADRIQERLGYDIEIITILNCKMKLELRNWDKGACPFIPIRAVASPYSQFFKTKTY